MAINIYTLLIALIPFLVDSHLLPSMSSYIPVLLIALLANQKFGIKKNDGFVQAMFLLVVTGMMRLTQYSVPLIKDIGLMGIGIVPFVFNSAFKVEARTLNRWFLYGYLFTVGANIFNFSFSISNFINSSFGLELGAYTYTLGLFAIYWAQKGKFSWTAINCLFVIVGGKRIAMATILICIIVAFLLRKKKGEAGIVWKLSLFSLVVFYLYLTFNFASHVYDEFILKYTDKSADAFTLGRQQLYSGIIRMIPNPNYWGIGPGNTVEPLNESVGLPRMHNDFLKIYAENGLFVFCAFFFFLLRKIKYKQIPTLLFIFAVFTSTNTLIYVYMLFMYCLFLNPDKYLYDERKDVDERDSSARLNRELKQIKDNERFYGRRYP